MLVENGNGQRVRTRALPKRRTCETRNNTTYTMTNTTIHKQRQRYIQQINNKQSIDKQRTMCYYNNVKRTTHNNKREEV